MVCLRVIWYITTTFVSIITNNGVKPVSRGMGREDCQGGGRRVSGR